MEESELAARYPFTEVAKRLISETQISDKIVQIAMERIRKAAEGQISTRILLSEDDRREWIASYAASRMILSYIKNSYLTNRFAVIESKTIRSYLDKADPREVDFVCAFFGVNTTNKDGKMFLDIPTFLKYSPRSIEYKLINRRIVGGKIELKAAELKRLLEEGSRKRIEQIPIIKEAPPLIEEGAKKVLESLPKTEVAKITIKVEDHPPCVQKLLDNAAKHINLNHQSRFYLATYLLGVGMQETEIAKLYSNLPDYSEKITVYQVGQIKKKGYTTPSCATVNTYGLCCANCAIGNPLNWHKLNKGRKEEIVNGTNK
jgi:DNA primase large subunit